MRSAAPRSFSFTREQYYRVGRAGVFDGRRVELIRGRVVQMSPQESRHATGVTLVAEVLRQLFGAGVVIRVQMPLPVGERSEPEPDVAVVPGSTRDYAGAHPTTALLVVEVAGSPLDFDRRVKAALYAAAGIPEYWIVNLVDRCLEVHREPVEGEYRRREVVAPDGSIAPLACPARKVAVADLLP